MNFVIYHSALRPFLELPDKAWAEFVQTGRIRWATDLAEIPQKCGRHQCLCRARRLLCQLGGGVSEVLRRAGRHAAWRSSKRGWACIGKQPQIAVPSTIALHRIRFADW
jgi:hypothetical protein